MCKRNLALLAFVLATLPPTAAADSPIPISGKLDADVASVRSSLPGAGTVLFDGAELYGQYTAILNLENGTYNFGDGLHITTSSGAAISGLGVGVDYAF